MHQEHLGECLMDALDHIAEICSREVKEEYDNSIQISLTMLSAYTKNPQNLRILAQTGEGKTYLVNHVSTLFPQENIIKLRNASPQSFKYLATKKVIEASPGIWQDYDIALEPLEEELKKTKIPERKKEIEKQTFCPGSQPRGDSTGCGRVGHRPG